MHSVQASLPAEAQGRLQHIEDVATAHMLAWWRLLGMMQETERRSTQVASSYSVLIFLRLLPSTILSFASPPPLPSPSLALPSSPSLQIHTTPRSSAPSRSAGIVGKAERLVVGPPCLLHSRGHEVASCFAFFLAFDPFAITSAHQPTAHHPAWPCIASLNPLHAYTVPKPHTEPMALAAPPIPKQPSPQSPHPTESQSHPIPSYPIPSHPTTLRRIPAHPSPAIPPHLIQAYPSCPVLFIPILVSALRWTK